MPKQGHFAVSRRRQKIRQFKVKRHDKGKTIDPAKLTDFLLVRFALTGKRRVPASHQESAQRFLQELIPAIRDHHGDVTRAVSQLLPNIRTRVPWQFFRQVCDEWPLLSHFLRRELPAVPLEKRLAVQNMPDAAAFNQMVGKALAEQTSALTMLNSKLPAVMRKQIAKSVEDSVIHDGQIDWRRVGQLFAPMPFDTSTAPDETTRQWLEKLKREN